MAGRSRRTAIITVVVAGVIAGGIAWRMLLPWRQHAGSRHSAFPLTLTALEEMSDGAISDYRLTDGAIVVSVVDRLGDAHIYFLLHEGMSQEEALNRLARKKVELENRIHGTLPLDISLLDNSTASGEVPKVIRAAKELWTPSRNLWPEPSSVSEHGDFWWVKFKEKPTLVIRDGRPAVKSSLPGGVCIRVKKADLSCSFVPAR